MIFLTASTLPAQDWARKLFATTEHDFGSVARGAKAEYAFVVTNNLQERRAYRFGSLQLRVHHALCRERQADAQDLRDRRDHRPSQQRHAHRSTGGHADGDFRSALLCRGAIADPRLGAYQPSHGTGQLAVRRRPAGQGERGPRAAVSRRLPRLADPRAFASPIRICKAKWSWWRGREARSGTI